MESLHAFTDVMDEGIEQAHQMLTLPCHQRQHSRAMVSLAVDDAHAALLCAHPGPIPLIVASTLSSTWTATVDSDSCEPYAATPDVRDSPALLIGYRVVRIAMDQQPTSTPASLVLRSDESGGMREEPAPSTIGRFHRTDLVDAAAALEFIVRGNRVNTAQANESRDRRIVPLRRVKLTESSDRSRRGRAQEECGCDVSTGRVPGKEDLTAVPAVVCAVLAGPVQCGVEVIALRAGVTEWVNAVVVYHSDAVTVLIEECAH